MLDSIHHMIVRSIKNRFFGVRTSSFSHLLRNVIMKVITSCYEICKSLEGIYMKVQAKLLWASSCDLGTYCTLMNGCRWSFRQHFMGQYIRVCFLSHILVL